MRGLPKQRYRFLPGYACQALAGGLLALLALPVQAQLDDLAADAQASRAELIAEVAAVDGEQLRERLAASAPTDALRQQYLQLRSKAHDDLVAHETLARWSEKQGLSELS